MCFSLVNAYRALPPSGRHELCGRSLYLRESSHCERESLSPLSQYSTKAKSVLMLAYVNFSLILQSASSEQLFSWQQLESTGFVTRVDQYCVLSLLPVISPKL